MEVRIKSVIIRMNRPTLNSILYAINSPVIGFCPTIIKNMDLHNQIVKLLKGIHDKISIPEISKDAERPVQNHHGIPDHQGSEAWRKSVPPLSGRNFSFPR